MNIVKDIDLLEYEKHIKRKAKGFIRKYNVPSARRVNEEVTISNVGWSQNDIEQELLIETWKLLRNYDPTKSFGPNGYCKKETFILDCLDNKLKMLNTRLWAKKRGYASPHDYESSIITGEYPEDEL